jgi:flagellin-like protein
LKFRKFRKNAKALSPVIATIILIAVTVAVSVVVAAWMGALTIGFMGNSEQASITNTVLSNYSKSGTNYQFANVTVQNTGSATVTINSALIDSNSAVMYAQGSSATLAGTAGVASVSISKGTSVTFTIAVAGQSFTNTAQYTIKLMTAKGNTVTGQATYTGG